MEGYDGMMYEFWGDDMVLIKTLILLIAFGEHSR